MKRKLSGFTLIELLVVIAIIGLLATLSVVALNTARVKARDARRQSDIHQIQLALEMYYNDYFQYPTGTLSTSTTMAISGAGISSTTSGTIYMAKIPTDPTPVSDGNCGTGAAYAYTQQGTNGSSYSLAYCLSSYSGTVTPASIK